MKPELSQPSGKCHLPNKWCGGALTGPALNSVMAAQGKALCKACKAARAENNRYTMCWYPQPLCNLLNALHKQQQSTCDCFHNDQHHSILATILLSKLRAHTLVMLCCARSHT